MDLPDPGSNPRSTALAASTLTIPQPMRLKDNERKPVCVARLKKNRDRKVRCKFFFKYVNLHMVCKTHTNI